MDLLPQDSPRRLLQLAIRWSRIVGILLAAPGLLGIALVVPDIVSNHSQNMLALNSVVLACFVPSATYIILAAFLADRHMWALIALITIAAIQESVVLLALMGALIGLASERDGGIVLALCIVGFVAAVTGQCLWHLSRAYPALRRDRENAQRGFEPLPPRRD